MRRFLALYLQPRLIAILLLGFSSGLPLALTASTLAVWLLEAQVDLAAIGLFAAVATPYNLKFLWAPLIDGLPFPFLSRLLGRRRGWMIATQLACAASLCVLGAIDPAQHVWWVALMAIVVAFCSASQDIVIDAYRVEILPAEQQGAGAAMVVLGYRFGMIASSAGALYLASYTSWAMTYWIMAALMGVGMVTALIAGEPATQVAPDRPHMGVAAWLKKHVAEPFADFIQRDHWLVILLFILFYKLADAFMGLMPNVFYRDIGFSKEEIATVVKLFGLTATIVGSFIGGYIVTRLGIVRSLWICGIAHALTNVMFVVQAHVGADIRVLALGITLENVTGGMGTAAFVAFMSSLCHVQFTATQYALLSSLSSVGRTWLSTPAGWVSKQLGWELFFVFATLLAIPGLLILAWLMRRVDLNKPA
ncbi:MAG: AmpG family muropeptide MFS transporter [Rickettsiales bacterium]|nr:AmpG family muropeptide MFS transporter [Rickettsiales bacterium]